MRFMRDEREHDLAPRAGRHRAADQAGVAALRHDRDALARAQRHDARHLLGASPGRTTHSAAAVYCRRQSVK